MVNEPTGSAACACPKVPCQGHSVEGESLCAVCLTLCNEPTVEHINSGKVREVFHVRT